MSRDLKVGDKVRCVHRFCNQILAGTIYTVTKIADSRSSKTPYWVYVIRSDGYGEGGYFAHSFELFTEPANDFIVRVLNGIQVGSFCGTFPSSEEAQKYVTDSGMPGLTYQIFEMVPAVTLSVKEVRTRTVEQVTP